MDGQAKNPFIRFARFVENFEKNVRVISYYISRNDFEGHTQILRGPGL